MSIPESENSSNGTFIDKGSCEELSKDEKPECALEAASSGQEAGRGLDALPGDSQAELKPPDSAFSTSDLSEQLSGPAP